jgi:hypothetical protein
MIISSVAVIATAVVPATPVAMIPRIITGPAIDPGSGVVSIIRIAIVGITAVIAGANSDSYPNMHSGIGLTGEAQHSQQRND